MANISLKTSKQIKPMIYAYTTPNNHENDGWIKIGYTEGDVDKRINQQAHVIHTTVHKEWQGSAIYDDGTNDRFTDKDFHRYLRKDKIANIAGTEWFKISPTDSRNKFYDFRLNRGLFTDDTATPYFLRKEQQDAVNNAVSYLESTEKGEFLINAKPRFGKTLTVYDFIKRINAQNVLIVTNRPAIANSWYDDYVQFLGPESDYLFVSNADALKGKKYVLSRDEYINIARAEDKFCIEFVSLQDLKGSIHFGGKYDKLREIKDLNWDVLVIDEAHEGVDTYKTDVAFDHIKRKYTLHLSGTPFKALATAKFPEKAIYNWTYADEQDAKASWPEDSEENNPYERLPKLNLYTYQMSEIVKDELRQGVEINGETEEYAFDLNEFFSTNALGRFIYDSSVDKFLDALTTLKKYPFSTPELRNEIKHSFWLLNRVDSARALAVKLKNHPVFKDYEIVLAAGDGKIDDLEETEKSFDKVKKAISEYDKTITLSVGQLTTGVTIPEWTAVLMLSNVKSPSLYMQAAFRSQNPCVFQNGEKFFRKENAYVFDFDPARTLITYEEFANDLSPETANGKGDTETRKNNIVRLLNFFPVIGEDDSGEMVELDAEKVLTIPRKIKSQEVVRRGFMSNYLFQNISHIFGAPQDIIDIISQFPPVPEGSPKVEIPSYDEDEPHFDENGEIIIPQEYVDNEVDELLGDNIYETIDQDVIDIISEEESEDSGIPEAKIDEIKDKLTKPVINQIIEGVKDKHPEKLRPSDIKKIEKQLNNKADVAINKAVEGYNIEVKVAESDRLRDLAEAYTNGKTEEQINREYDEIVAKAKEKLQETLVDTTNDFVEEAAKDAVVTAESMVKAYEKKDYEDTTKDHLRGFARTIPSFLMAYGEDSVTLATFDEVIPDKVFVEVTSITLDQFRFLRDGGDYTDSETGEQKHFDGQLFDPIVFDDSVKEFLRLKKKLADYFDEKSIEDIFDYIPPQKTNQIFTPKIMVKKMVDMLEEENPGCFDNPDKTFIDLYMKSGLYITEIVKRLYQSDEMKKKFPDRNERLRHIFEKQVYGLAPTEIIYNIALSYILGFADDVDIPKHNLRLADALPYAKEGKLQELLDELFPGE